MPKYNTAAAKENIFNSANNHQELALMNNLCFQTVVLAIKSAEVQHCRRKTKKAQQWRKASNIGNVEQLCLALLYPSIVLKQNTVSEKKKIVKQCRKSSKVGTVEQHSFRRCCTKPQQCRSTTLPPKKKLIIKNWH